MTARLWWLGPHVGIALMVSLASGCDALHDPTGPDGPDAVQSSSFTRAGVPLTPLCHWTGGSKEFVRIEVAAPALEAHLRHGDASIGDPVSDRPDTVFDEKCLAVTVGYSISGHTFYSSTPLDGVVVELLDGSPTGLVLATSTSVGGGSFSFTGILPGTYRLKFYGPDPSFVGWTSPAPFEVSASDVVLDWWLPKDLHLLSPTDGAFVATSNPTLEWSPLGEAALYTVQINESLTWALLEQATSGSASYVVQSPLTPGIEYTWQVDARDAAGRWVGGTMDSFTMTY